jgi:hypothetical protein
MMAVTITLPDEVFARIRRLAEKSGQDVEEILSDSSNLFMAFLREFDSTPVQELSDDEVRALADSHMDTAQNLRFSELQYRQKMGEITEDEKQELRRLFEIYNAGELRMAEALVEAAKRNLTVERLK